MAQSTSPVTSEIVRGRVTGDSGRAVAGATVIVTKTRSAPPYTASNAPDEIATRFAQAGFLDPVRLILAVRDSLVSSAAQSRELAAMHARYTAASDSIWHQLGAYLASLPTKYSEADVLDHVRDARLSALDLLGETTRELKATLTPDQLGMLSPDLLQLIDERLVEYRRRAELRSY